MGASFSLVALEGIPEVRAGDDLAAGILGALRCAGLALAARDVLVVAQKIVSKAEGRLVDLAEVTPSPRAVELAAVTGKNARLVEVILSESHSVVRAAPNVLIVRHRLGYVMANAGIDRSNVPCPAGRDLVLLLPRDPDASAAALRARLEQAAGGVPLGVVVSDSFGRPWRQGTTNVALGSSGIPALVDRRGERDREGRVLEMTQVAFADAIAAGAGVAMGEAAEGTPVVLVRGLAWNAPERGAGSLVRPVGEDLFQ